MIVVNIFKSRMADKYLYFDRFCNVSCSDYIKCTTVLKMIEQYKLTIFVQLIW